MATTYTQLPAYGAVEWQSPVATFADLPTTDPLGYVRVVEDEKAIYYYDGTTWLKISSTTTVVGPIVSTDKALPRWSGTNGNTLQNSGVILDDSNNMTGVTSVTITGLTASRAVVTGAGGLLSSATTTSTEIGYVNGVTSAIQTQLNAKEPAITAGTTADYWRGDKTFQTLQMSALTAVTSGAAASTGKVGEILTASQASATTTGVGATGVWGAVTSVSLTAGAWRVFGVVGFTENGATLNTSLSCAVSASATASGVDEFDTCVTPSLISGSSDALYTTPAVYVNISGTTTYYLNSRFYYSAGTPQHRGKIIAERVR